MCNQKYWCLRNRPVKMEINLWHFSLRPVNQAKYSAMNFKEGSIFFKWKCSMIVVRIRAADHWTTWLTATPSRHRPPFTLFLRQRWRKSDWTKSSGQDVRCIHGHVISGGGYARLSTRPWSRTINWTMLLVVDTLQCTLQGIHWNMSVTTSCGYWWLFLVTIARKTFLKGVSNWKLEHWFSISQLIWTMTTTTTTRW